ncbi:ShlB/FhaC/HecB family hemolysin secretion/activation protein [Nostoc sp. FACHB-110]|uniref:ShlB/FhaC/HecB family hemolysin secretion/activation protein n=1 Tax=Nostoc sp. FACHB-110 TaxID=2692834 RepID=UPI00168720DD|nr:ShlB/FhaC/HecB family hemolysin secretion/activation protein [Nostoc sp. FACHB-110]MBD2436317.1 ShlB/FhaC/HecB family hemolysin secretion/activation protein [Nostoc sp. FACHB-110]
MNNTGFLSYQWYLIFSIISLTIPFNSVNAQILNLESSQPGQPPSTQPLPELSPPTQLPPIEELLQPNTTSPTLEQQSLGEDSATIVVKKFAVTGSTVFSEEDFAKITAPYTNRPIKLQDLYKLRSEITNLYIQNEYITSGAYIPPQKRHDGIVEIKIVEGELEQIKITGTRRLNPAYVQSRLATNIHQPLKRDRLLAALQLLQLNPLIASISAELSASTQPGKSLLEVQVKEANTFNTQIVLDNGRSPAVGSFSRQIQVSEANLSGWGDRLSASYTNTDGSNAYDFSYTLPINPHNGTLALSYGTSNNRVIEEPFSVLDIQSDSHYYELTLRQPIIQKQTQELALGLTASHRASQARFLNGELPFPSSGADAQGRTNITSIRFFQEWTARSNQQVLALRSQLSLGIDAFNATINNHSVDSRFLAWRGQAQWVRLLAPNTLVLLKGDLQLADRPLVPFEQIGIGGQDNVRGYRQDALLTDNGVFASAEVRIPIAQFWQGKSLLQLAPFVDFGTGWNNPGRSSPANLSRNTLLSTGLGLRWQWQNYLTVRLDWGIPLVSPPSGDGNSWQENGLYFSIVANPF